MAAVCVIVNPSAGGGRARKVLARIEQELHTRDVKHAIRSTESLDHARSLAVEACGRGEICAAVGGDGLVGAVAAGVSAAGGTMAILPGGRGNDLARVLGVPTDPVKAVDVLLDGRETAIDLGEANGRSFCCIASCGYDSDANRIANATRLPGSLAYLWAAIRALLAWKPARFTLVADGIRMEFSGYSVIAANSAAYGGGMFIAPHADLQDGMLDLVTIGAGSRLRFLLLLPLVFKGRHVETAQVDESRLTTLTIEADRPFTVYADGDPICELPATITVRPRAVKMMVPA